MLKTIFLWFALIMNIVFLVLVIQEKSPEKVLASDVKISYCEYNRDVLDLVWCCLTYDRRKIAPLGTELILRPFDFRPSNLSDYTYHSKLTKEMNDYLSENPKNESVSVYIGRTKESWNIFTNAVEKYNQNVRKRNTMKGNLYMIGLSPKYDEELRFDKNQSDKKDLKKVVRSIYKRDDK